MKFDFAIGNPPYQEESETESTVNGQKPRKNIFHYFQIEADKIVNQSSVMIYPGGRWLHQSGKGLQQFGKDLINDKTLSTVEFFPDSKELFGQAADLSDGITIVTKLKNKESDGFNYVYTKQGVSQAFHADNPGDDLLPLNPNDLQIVRKIIDFMVKHKLPCLHDAILPRSLFSIESDFVEKNPASVEEYVSGKRYDWKRKIKLLTNDKAGKAGRAKWFVADRKLITQNMKYIDEWQVIVSSANAGGQKRDNQIEIADNHSAYGRVRVGLRSFGSEIEAKHFYKYVNTYLIKYAFLMTDEALTSLGKAVPDIVDYSSANKLIDFSKDLNTQLNELVGLTAEEISYIEERVNNLRRRDE